jgi:hypothetical protein
LAGIQADIETKILHIVFNVFKKILAPNTALFPSYRNWLEAVKHQLLPVGVLGFLNEKF